MACELFEELTGLPLRVHTAHEMIQEVAAGLYARQGLSRGTCQSVAERIALVCGIAPVAPTLAEDALGATVIARRVRVGA